MLGNYRPPGVNINIIIVDIIHDDDMIIVHEYSLIRSAEVERAVALKLQGVQYVVDT